MTTTPPPWQTPVTLSQGNTTNVDGELVGGIAGKLIVVTGIDVVSSVAGAGSFIQFGLGTSGATFYYFLSESELPTHDTWRGGVVIVPTDSLNVGMSAVFDWSWVVWGYTYPQI
jgi:hypothetical protein